MITRVLPSLMIGLAMGLSFFTSAHAAASKVNLTVRSINVQDKKTDAKTDKDKKPEADVDQKKLAATVKNPSKEAVAGLQIRFFYLGRAAGDSAIKVLQKDTKSKDLAAGEQAVVESNVMVATFTAAHTTKPNKDSKEKPERVKAAGDKFSGWAVQAFSGEELVGEAYSSPAMKTALGADAAPAPKP